MKGKDSPDFLKLNEQVSLSCAETGWFHHRGNFLSLICVVHVLSVSRRLEAFLH